MKLHIVSFLFLGQEFINSGRGFAKKIIYSIRVRCIINATNKIVDKRRMSC